MEPFIPNARPLLFEKTTFPALWLDPAALKKMPPSPAAAGAEAVRVAPEAPVAIPKVTPPALAKFSRDALTELTESVMFSSPELTTVGTVYDPVMVAIEPAVLIPNANPLAVENTILLALTDEAPSVTFINPEFTTAGTV